MQISFLLFFILGFKCMDYCMGHTCSGRLDYSCGEGNSECIPSAWRCDNVKDCSNGKDEVNCNFIFCPLNTFKCKSRECVAPTMKCDGKVDCADGSDEAFCNLSPSSHSNEHVQREEDLQGQEDVEEGGEISLDSPLAGTLHATSAWSQQPKGDKCTSRHSRPVLNFTGTYIDDGVESKRLYVAVQAGGRKVFTLEEAFDRDAWSLCQYLANKLK